MVAADRSWGRDGSADGGGIARNGRERRRREEKERARRKKEKERETEKRES